MQYRIRYIPEDKTTFTTTYVTAASPEAAKAEIERRYPNCRR
jgi:hypothetical protein